jgi:ribosomal protein L10
VLDKAGVQALAAIPSREELLAKLLGVMQAPVSGFAGLLAALAKNVKKKPRPDWSISGKTYEIRFGVF